MACCGRRREEAEDVLHDVYVKVLGARRGSTALCTEDLALRHRPPHSHESASHATRACTLGVRNARRIDGRTAPVADDDAVAADRRARTRHALARLSRRQSEVLELVFYHDLTIEEAARIMDVVVGRRACTTSREAAHGRAPEAEHP